MKRGCRGFSRARSRWKARRVAISPATCQTKAAKRKYGAVRKKKKAKR